MPKIDERIRDIDKTICQNIDLIDFETVSRALVSQNLLSQSRNLVEHVAVKAYADAKGEDLEADWETIPAATEYIKHHNKFQFLRKFHNFLQESKSHYTPDGEGAERLVLKYYKFYMILRNFVKQEYQMDILHNLEKFPINTDHAVQEYHDKIAERLELRREIRDLTHNPRMYVHKVVPFVSGEAVYYEIVLTPAYDTTSKFDRFVCYSKIMIPSHYSAKMDIYYETIEVNGRKMPVNILTDFMVSIRPCELNNFAKIFGDDIKMSPSHSEYIGNNKSKAYRWGLWTFKVGDPILFNESERFMPVLYNNLKGKIVDISLDEEEDCIWFSIKVEKEISEDEVWHTDLKLLESDEEGKSIVKFRVTRKKDSDDDKEFADDTDIPFQIAYAVSIHKAQGLEYDSVKVIITEEVDEMITHNIFYTAITRSKKHLKIYWSPETQEKVIGGFELADAKRDASIFKAQTGMRMYKVR